MNFYQLNLATLVAANIVLAYQQHRQAKFQEIISSTASDIENPARKEEIDGFKRDYFIVYMLVMASDWLQVSITVARRLRTNNQPVSRALIYMRCIDMREDFQKRRLPEPFLHHLLVSWQTSTEGEQHA